MDLNLINGCAAGCGILKPYEVLVCGFSAKHHVSWLVQSCLINWKLNIKTWVPFEFLRWCFQKKLPFGKPKNIEAFFPDTVLILTICYQKKLCKHWFQFRWKLSSFGIRFLFKFQLDRGSTPHRGCQSPSGSWYFFLGGNPNLNTFILCNYSWKEGQPKQEKCVPLLILWYRTGMWRDASKLCFFFTLVRKRPSSQQLYQNLRFDGWQQ